MSDDDFLNIGECHWCADEGITLYHGLANEYLCSRCFSEWENEARSIQYAKAAKQIDPDILTKLKERWK